MQMRIILTPIKDNTASASTESTSAKRLRVALGTLVAVEATSSCSAAAEAAIEAAFAAVAEVHSRMHPQSPDSDLGRINTSPPNTHLTVHPSVRELLEFARRLNLLTQGAFDPCLPSRPGRLEDIEISSEYVSCRVPVALDFGGFAKGFAVDQAIGALLRNGCIGGLVNAGGDLRVFGPRTEPLLVRGPTGELQEARFTEGALAVSDADSQNRPAEHQGYYVRNREGGDAVAEPLVRRYAAVMAKEAMIADALSKCVLVCAPAIAERALQAFGATPLHLNAAD